MCYNVYLSPFLVQDICNISWSPSRYKSSVTKQCVLSQPHTCTAHSILRTLHRYCHKICSDSKLESACKYLVMFLRDLFR